MNPSISEQSARLQPFLPAYEVIEPLGEGAVATVFKVRAAGNGSIRALKVLKPEQATSEGVVRRFEDEFRILSNLHHPGLPEMFDYGVAGDGTRYMVMECVDGVPLDRYFAEHKTDLWLLIYELVEVLSFIHGHDLLHLDLKPSNVLVKKNRPAGETGRPMSTLIDFGLSYRRDGGRKLKLVGTPGYIAPEVIREQVQPTRAADYYSLGVILYELVEGDIPFGGSLHEILQAPLVRAISFTEKKMEYAELYPWIEKLLGKEPQTRLEAFQEFRRNVAARLGEASEDLDRVYALGHIESLGLIGKRHAWDRVCDWLRDGARVLDRSHLAGAVDVPPPRKDPSRTGSFDLRRPVDGLDDRIKKDLLRDVSDVEADENAQVHPADVCRYVAVSGPTHSGKSYLLDAFRKHVLPEGMRAIALGDTGDVRLFLDDGVEFTHSRSVDPRSLIIDRFIARWERLQSMARDGGLVVLVDDYGMCEEETHEFLGYVVRRVALETSEGREPGMLFVIAGDRPSLAKELSSLGVAASQVLAIDIPPPGDADVEALLDRLGGRVSGARDREALERFLKDHRESDGAVMMCLRRALASRWLRYEGGVWEFGGNEFDAVDRPATSAEYYQYLLPVLSVNARTLLHWLSCHPGTLSLSQIEELSGLLDTELVDAIESLRAYRVLETTGDVEDVHVRLVSVDIRNALYQMLDTLERRKIHSCFIEYFTGYGSESVESYEALAFHYEGAGEIRDAMLMRVKALRMASKRGNIFDIRRLCAAGLRDLPVPKGSPTVGLGEPDCAGGTIDSVSMERFFTRTWLGAEWRLHNFSAVVRIVEEYLATRETELPLSFAYKYVTALQHGARIETCRRVIDETKNRLAGEPSETLHNMRIAEAVLEHELGRYERSIECLDQVDPTALSDYMAGQLYVYYVLSADKSGHGESVRRYSRKARTVTSKRGQYENRLRFEYNRIEALLHNSRYDEVKRRIRRAIRLAARHRVYRSHCAMNFLASAAYYEEGDYTRALRSLDKAIRMAAGAGMNEIANEYRLRYAMNYQNMGLYGSALHYVDSVLRQTSPDDYADDYFYAVLVRFELHLLIHSEERHAIKKQLERLAPGVRAKFRRGYYHRLLGSYRDLERDYAGAVAEYERARDIYERIGYCDDAARTELLIGYSHIAAGSPDAASEILCAVRPAVASLRSADITAEFHGLVLARQCVVDEGETALLVATGRCEGAAGDIKDVNVELRMHAWIFRAYGRLHDPTRAFQVFARYYSKVKEICSNLPDSAWVSAYIQNDEFAGMVRDFKAMKEKTRDSVS